MINGSKAFPEGSVLSNRSAYFTSAAPVLRGEFEYTYNATDGALRAQTSLALRVHAVETDQQGEETVYWEFTRQLDQSNEWLSPGEETTVSFAENMSAVAEQIQQVQKSLGGSPGTPEAVFVATVDLNGTRNRNRIDTERTYRLPVTFERNLYAVNDTGPMVERRNKTLTERETVVVPASPLEGVGGPIMLLVGLVSVSSLGYGRYDDRIVLSERERERLTYQQDRTEFDDWITEANVITEQFETADRHVETTSLAGLVDIAIDIDRRVIEVTDHELYFVLDGDVLFSYEPPTLEAEADPADDDSAEVETETEN